MVEFTLPKNSKITRARPGRTRRKAAHETEFRIYRWNPDDGPIRASTPITSTATIAGRWFSTR